MKFTGHERDLENGQLDPLDYMHARYYSAQWGRFLSVDRVGGSARNPQTYNRYVYARNSPLKLKDPTGLYFVLACEEDRQFFSEAIARGTRNRSSRERFLFLANDSRRFELRTGSLPGTTSGLFDPNPSAKSATITIDPSKYPDFWRTPTSTVFHEFLHAVDFFWMDNYLYIHFGDKNDPDAGTYSVFTKIGYQAESNPDDAANSLTADEVSAFLQVRVPAARGTTLLRRYYVRPYDYTDPFRGTGFCDASNTCH